MNYTGPILKMRGDIAETVAYTLPIGDHLVDMNPLIGSTLEIGFEGEIRCINCDRKTNKSFNQGHCFPCFRRLARCDGCIVRPETCHYDQGTCREPEWGEQHCLIDHTVYLSNTGALKVGITRRGNEHIRWVDQGASEALAIWRVPNRLSSGQVEVVLKDHVSDRTNWRTMLQGAPAPVDLIAARDELVSHLHEGIPGHAIADAQVQRIQYPVQTYPVKVKSIAIEKTGTLRGELQGIKGQYLIFDCGVINTRKYQGYVWTLSAV